jgi:hypothetical protein
MRAILCIAMFLSIGPFAVSAEILMQNTFIVAGTNYVSVVSNADLEKSSVWIESDEHPPLSPRRAMRAAQATVTKLFKGVTTIVDFVSLHPVGRENKWIYQVQFTTIPARGLEGDSAPIRLFVLMSGEVVPPKPEMAKRGAGAGSGPEQRNSAVTKPNK